MCFLLAFLLGCVTDLDSNLIYSEELSKFALIKHISALYKIGS